MKVVTRTKVMINGEDVSPLVTRCSIPRFPERLDLVELTLIVSEFEVESDGTLVVHVESP